MFTHRICCCSATVASQVMACIALVLCAITTVVNWFDADLIYINIYQTVLLIIEIVACVLVFIACCRLQPPLMLPIIVIQIINSISIVALAIWVMIDVWWALTALGVVYYICIYAISLLISLFVLHCHVCCYKLLLVKKHAVHHHHADHCSV